ncbi:hypothetical protein FNW54_07625 [Bacteroides sp. HF-5092]|nr:hypothetical protein FNW54_20760 [Bacteroides sp. HF-5092]TRX46201.1 hypothetical protein FNW54_07625 [Bacteroides sp. HF-5092]
MVMKRITFFLFAMLISSMSLFTACSDDDDDATSSEMVAGTYNGTLVVSLGGTEVANEPKSLSLVKNGDDAIDVVINDFKLNVSLGGAVIPVSLGNLKVEKCTLTQKDGKYTFNGSKDLKDIEVPLGDGDPTPVDCTVNIVNATVEGNNLNLPIVVGVMGTLTVNVQYTGTK